MYKMFAPPPKEIYNRLKASAKKRGIPFDLLVTDLYELSYPITCPINGLVLKWNKGQAQDDSYSFDRIDSALGYTIDNLQIISWRANRLKSDATLLELEQLSGYHINIKHLREVIEKITSSITI